MTTALIVLGIAAILLLSIVLLKQLVVARLLRQLNRIAAQERTDGKPVEKPE